MANVLNPAAVRNYDRWPILSRYIWPNFFIGATYGEEINYMKEWIAGRLEWMDDNIPGECLPVSGTADIISTGLSLVPNPAVNSFAIKTTEKEILAMDISICTTSGQPVRELKSILPNTQVDISALPAGVYIVSISTHLNAPVQQKLIIVD